ncbi:hypothetical protein QQ045_031344 [Rhodiola kirilowii]
MDEVKFMFTKHIASNNMRKVMKFNFRDPKSIMNHTWLPFCGLRPAKCSGLLALYVDPIWKIKRFLNLGSEALIKADKKVIKDFVYGVIRVKREQMRLQQDFEDILSRFLVESNKDPNNMIDHDLKDIILNFMIAGKDTSAVTLSLFIYMLCKNPLVQEKVLQEIRDTININDDNEEHSVESFIAKISDSVLVKMHYLNAALTETLRLYPAVLMNGRCAEEDDTLPDGYKLRKGDGVYYMSYAMGRMPYIWGDDADDFKPERWIENGIFQNQSPFKFIAFHGWANYRVLKDLLRDGIFAVDGDKWRQQRKYFSHEFSTKVLKNFSSSY